MGDWVQVTAKAGLRMRESPGTGATMLVLPEGTELEVLGRETWLRVQFGATTGCLLADGVEPLIPSTVSAVK